MATKKEIAKLVRGLEGGYMTQCSKWTEAQWTQVYHRWFEVLGPVLLPLLEAASKYCALTEKWFPQPNQIVDALVAIQGMIEGRPTPEEAWQEARVLIGRRIWWNGDYTEWTVRDVQESDCRHTLVFEVINRIGLRELRGSDSDVWVGREFKRVYERECRSQQQMDVVTALLPEIQGVPRLTSKAQPAITAETGRF